MGGRRFRRKQGAQAKSRRLCRPSRSPQEPIRECWTPQPLIGHCSRRQALHTRGESQRSPPSHSPKHAGGVCAVRTDLHCCRSTKAGLRYRYLGVAAGTRHCTRGESHCVHLRVTHRSAPMEGVVCCSLWRWWKDAVHSGLSELRSLKKLALRLVSGCMVWRQQRRGG